MAVEAGRAPIPFKSKNKLKRSAAYLRVRQAKEKQKREERFRRRKEEDRNPDLRVQRRKRNVPLTIDKKRVWDDVDEGTEGDGLGLSVDIGVLKRRRLDEEMLPQGSEELKQGLTEEKLKKIEDATKGEQEGLEDVEDGLEDGVEPEDSDETNSQAEADSEEDDLASILEESDSNADSDDMSDKPSPSKRKRNANNRQPSPQASTTSTAISLIPDALAAKFPTLFEPRKTIPKILITTTLGGTIHAEAETLTQLFPNSMYVPRQRHRYKSHHFSLREISRFATNRNFTTLLVLNEDQKRPAGLTCIHLPAGPTLHFGLRNWVPGKALPGHGNATDHDPELILNGFRTPLGLLTAHFFRGLFPPTPELVGRQVVTLHNQRDYIFVRRHRYIFRDKRATEKSVTTADGENVKGVEDVRAGLQELGPRFTLKLRRVDKGIQRASGQEWEWKAGMEKVRTKFQL